MKSYTSHIRPGASPRPGLCLPLRGAHREGVDKDAQEQQENEENDEEDDGTPEPPPQDELHRLVRGGKPEEGGVGAPGSEIPEVSRALLSWLLSPSPALKSPRLSIAPALKLSPLHPHTLLPQAFATV